MTAVFVLLPLGLLFAGICVAWFVWAVRSGQYDDLETPAVRMLFDDDERPARTAARSETPSRPSSSSSPLDRPWSRSQWRSSAPHSNGKAELP